MHQRRLVLRTLKFVHCVSVVNIHVSVQNCVDFPLVQLGQSGMTVDRRSIFGVWRENGLVSAPLLLVALDELFVSESFKTVKRVDRVIGIKD